MKCWQKAIVYGVLFQLVLAGLIITSGRLPESLLQLLERSEWILVPGIKLFPTSCGFPLEESPFARLMRVLAALSINLAVHSVIAYVSLLLLRKENWRTVNEASVEQP